MKTEQEKIEAKRIKAFRKKVMANINDYITDINVVCSIDSNGNKWVKDYDALTGRLISEKSSAGDHFTYKYDAAGNMTFFGSGVGHRSMEYHPNGKMSYSKDSSGEERWFDSQGTLIKFKFA